MTKELYYIGKDSYMNSKMGICCNDFGQKVKVREQDVKGLLDTKLFQNEDPLKEKTTKIVKDKDKDNGKKPSHRDKSKEI